VSENVKDNEPRTETVGIDNATLRNPNRLFYRFVKRVADILFSFLGLIVLSPVFLITAICIKLDSPGPVLFNQIRAGKTGKPFLLYKFRSMCKNAEKQLMESDAIDKRDGTPFIDKPKNDTRITKVGRLIRVTSIDELPQLLNVLIGNMSLVGPRPLAMYVYEAMQPRQQQRNSVKPGITCIWQVSGRNNIVGQERVEMDLRYVRECGLWADIVLLLKTIPALISRKGAY